MCMICEIVFEITKNLRNAEFSLLKQYSDDGAALCMYRPAFER